MIHLVTRPVDVTQPPPPAQHSAAGERWAANNAGAHFPANNMGPFAFGSHDGGPGAVEMNDIGSVRGPQPLQNS